LFIASQHGYQDIVTLLLQNQAHINANYKTGSSPLYVACQNGHEEVAKLLIESQATIDSPRKNGSTPLFVSCKNGHTNIVNLLLQKRAHIDMPRKDGLTAIDVAKYNNHRSVMDLLLDANKGAGSESLNGKALKDWTEEEVYEYFNHHSHLSKIATILRDEAINGTALLKLTSDDYKSIGFKLGHVKNMEEEIKKLSHTTN